LFNKRNYPNLTPLFEQLGVPIQKSDMTFAATIDGGALEWCARDLNGVFGQRRNLLRPSFYRLMGQVARFNREAAAAVRATPDLTLGGLIAQLRLSKKFLNYYILPMGGALWRAPPSKILDFPAATFVRFFENHGLLATSGQPQWYTVSGGSREYVSRITAPFIHRIRTDCAVTRVTRENGMVQVQDVRGETLAARGWTEEGGNLWDVLARLEDAGCSRYVVTDVTRDGMLNGPNLELLASITRKTGKPVVASGGISSLDDLVALR
jgi:predicted NAD/FAD-binding protein